MGPVRIFVGSGEASLLERKVLIHSLRRTTRRPVEVHVFNGTHNSIERDGRPPEPAPLPLDLKYRNTTEFSCYRFVIPEVCGHQGRAIYLDSDTICLQDVGELFDADLGTNDLLARADAYEGGGRWATSVLVMDCARTRFDLAQYYREIDARLYTLTDLQQLAEPFLRHHPLCVGRLDPRWNSFDHRAEDTRLIHYTNLLTQPWRFAGHPHAGLWFEHLRAAMAAGEVTPRDVELSALRGHIRPDLLDVAFGRRRLRRAAGGLRRWLGAALRGE